MTSTERDLAKRAATAARIMLEYEAWEMPAPPPADPLDYAWTAQVITDQADALASIRAERDAAVADVAEWFDACWKVSGTGMSKVRFLERYRAHLGVSEEAAKRAARAIAGEQNNDA